MVPHLRVRACVCAVACECAAKQNKILKTAATMNVRMQVDVTRFAGRHTHTRSSHHIAGRRSHHRSPVNRPTDRPTSQPADAAHAKTIQIQTLWEQRKWQVEGCGECEQQQTMGEGRVGEGRTGEKGGARTQPLLRDIKRQMNVRRSAAPKTKSNNHIADDNKMKCTKFRGTQNFATKLGSKASKSSSVIWNELH